MRVPGGYGHVSSVIDIFLQNGVQYRKIYILYRRRPQKESMMERSINSALASDATLLQTPFPLVYF